MRFLLPLTLLAAGCAGGDASSLARARAFVPLKGEVQQGTFSTDGKAFVGWFAPLGSEPRAFARENGKTWILWSTTDGKELARWKGDPLPGFLVPGSSDGKSWAAVLPDKSGSLRFRLLDFTTGAVGDLPGIAGTKDSPGGPPSYSADRSRLAYSVHEEKHERRTGRVYEAAAGGWRRAVEVPGEHAKISPDGTLVATVGRNPANTWQLQVRLYGVADGKLRWAAKVDSYGLAGFTPDGRYIVQSDNHDHRLFEVRTGEQRLRVSKAPGFTNETPNEVAFRDGQVTAVIRNESKAELVRWDVTEGVEVSRTVIESPFGGNDTRPFVSPLLPVILKTPSQPALGRPGAGVSSTTVAVYDPAAKEPIARATFGVSGRVVVSPDGGTLAIVGSTSLAFYSLPSPK